MTIFDLLSFYTLSGLLWWIRFITPTFFGLRIATPECSVISGIFPLTFSFFGRWRSKFKIHLILEESRRKHERKWYPDSFLNQYVTKKNFLRIFQKEFQYIRNSFIFIDQFFLWIFERDYFFFTFRCWIVVFNRFVSLNILKPNRH